jgi:hypothetical protein
MDLRGTAHHVRQNEVSSRMEASPPRADRDYNARANAS